jgi:hypothetical protein
LPADDVTIRDASEWLPLMTDPLLAQSAIDWLTSTCHELIIEGDSYRRRQRPPARVVALRACSVKHIHLDGLLTLPGSSRSQSAQALTGRASRVSGQY